MSEEYEKAFAYVEWLIGDSSPLVQEDIDNLLCVLNRLEILEKAFEIVCTRHQLSSEDYIFEAESEIYKVKP